MSKSRGRFVRVTMTPTLTSHLNQFLMATQTFKTSILKMTTQLQLSLLWSTSKINWSIRVTARSCRCATLLRLKTQDFFSQSKSKSYCCTTFSKALTSSSSVKLIMWIWVNGKLLTKSTFLKNTNINRKRPNKKTLPEMRSQTVLKIWKKRPF